MFCGSDLNKKKLMQQLGDEGASVNLEGTGQVPPVSRTSRPRGPCPPPSTYINKMMSD